MQFIKNITSKDIKLSQNTILNLIKTKDVDKFSHLCENADFIFPFLKERITNDFVKLINKNDLDCVFEFTKVYSFDFEEMILNSWLKFASEDLTDEILNLFERGTREQKAYCALYFTKILDSLALEYLYQNYNSDFEPLRINSIKALKAFNDKKIIQDEIKKLELEDEFEKLKTYEFLSIFNEIKLIVKNGLNSPLSANVVCALTDYNDLNSLKENLEKEDLMRILNIIIENYPEDISLDTVLYYQIFEFLKFISGFDDIYAKNILLLAKAKFKEFTSSDVYLFDFDKQIKSEIQNISKFLNSLDLKVDEIDETDELQKYDTFSYRTRLALDIIEEYGLKNNSSLLIDLFNNSKINSEFLIRIAKIIKSQGMFSLLDKNVIDKIEDLNVKSLILSYEK